MGIEVLAGHTAPGATVIVDGLGTFTLAELLPRPFTLRHRP